MPFGVPFGILSDFRMYGAFPFGTIPFGELLRRRLRRRSSAIVPPPRPFARKSTKRSVPVGMAAHRRKNVVKPFRAPFGNPLRQVEYFC